MFLNRDEQAALWKRLSVFKLDDPESPFPFTHRLARENRWSLEYAQRVVEEYKRFAMLAVVAGHPVTPSDEVDQVWHLHLVYTRSYWDEFCGKILCRPLHHGPTKGGSAESVKFHDWYARTLESYRRIFNEEPPADIWPPAPVRFGATQNFARVNTGTHWVVPRPSTLLRRLKDHLLSANHPFFRSNPRIRRIGIPLVAFIALALILGGCVAPGPGGRPDPWNLENLSGPDFLRFYLPLAMMMTIASIVLRWKLRPSANEMDELDHSIPVLDASKLDPYEAALLVHGPDRKVLGRVAIVKLIGRGVAGINGDKLYLTANDDPSVMNDLDPFEELVADQLESAPKRLVQIPYNVAASFPAEEVEARLRKWGVLIDPGDSLRIRVLPALLLFLVIALGIWRIHLGVVRERPVGFLVMACFALGVVAVLHLSARPWRTAKGNAVAADLRKQAASHAPAVQPEFTALAFAVLGASALPDSEIYNPLRTALNPPTGCGGSSCGGGSGCGGGGCGGGGCGGCGG